MRHQAIASDFFASRTAVHHTIAWASAHLDLARTHARHGRGGPNRFRRVGYLPNDGRQRMHDVRRVLLLGARCIRARHRRRPCAPSRRRGAPCSVRRVPRLHAHDRWSLRSLVTEPRRPLSLLDLFQASRHLPRTRPRLTRMRWRTRDQRRETSHRPSPKERARPSHSIRPAFGLDALAYRVLGIRPAKNA